MLKSPYRTVPALLFLVACAAGTGGLPDSGGRADGGASGSCTTDSECPDDGVFCNGIPVCREGVCGDGAPPACDDGIACTIDECMGASDECQNTPDDSLCPDQTVCQVGMGCAPPTVCEFDSDCRDDGVFCNGGEICDGGLCTDPGTDVCDDGDSCTVDSCVEANEACENVAADHRTDPMACGLTGNDDCVVCPGPTAAQVNVRALCANGACLFDCEDGFSDSDGDLANGCECMGGASDDEPDEDFLDTNCDGLDGDVSRAILVSVTMGNDTATCGLATATPCRTIAHAMVRGISESRRDLFLMAGTYDEIVTLRDGVRIFGGYDTAWVRGPRSSADHRTLIEGDLHGTLGQHLTVVAHGLVVAPTLENLVLRGPDAVAAGLSSYVIHARDSVGLDVVRSTLIQGHGAAGAVGAAGTDAPSTAATSGMGGGSGGGGASDILNCDDSFSGAAGSAGTNSCGAGGPSVDGGAGGAGGTRDTSCIGGVFCDGSDCAATAGAEGSSAGQFIVGGAGYRGAAGSTCLTLAPTGGRGGAVDNGAPGAGATDVRGTVVSGFWVGGVGSAGGTGSDGGGGGGGGGSGGCDDLPLPTQNSYGAGGGGGGAGGCAALAGGGGGGGGGGSFGLFALNSMVHLDDVSIQLGNGGVGGMGGVGGRGQSGGPAGTGGVAGPQTHPGGAGSAGGHGGHGGGGGGGAGGLSFGVFVLNAAVTVDTPLFDGGAGGGAGPGGDSAPSAPAAEDDGSDGLPGVTGLHGETFTCAAEAGC